MFGRMELRELILTKKDRIKGGRRDSNLLNLLDIKCRLSRESDDRHVCAAQIRRTMRFVRTRQIRDESGDNAAHGEEIGMKSDRL